MKKQLLTLAAGLVISMNVNAITIDETNVINNAAVASGFPVESRDYTALATNELIAEHWLDSDQSKLNRLSCVPAISSLVYECKLTYSRFYSGADAGHQVIEFDKSVLWSAECGNTGCVEAGK